MHGLSESSTSWLALTPEPERDLPELLAHLHEGTRPSPPNVKAEEDRVTHLVLRGTGRRWLRYLDRAAELAIGVADETRAGDPELALAVAEVVLEHDRMLIGLPGSGYDRTADRRRRLGEAVATLRARTERWS